MSRLAVTVADAVRRHGLWTPGARVAVAVSGGADSVALLHLLVEGVALHGGVLSVVTVDHGTRPDSAADADFVLARAASLGLPARAVRAALGPEASEAACRSARAEAYASEPADVIALGHHADDLAETAVLAWLRGHGSRGLGSLRPRAGRLVRPLLEVPRATLRAWLDARGLTWREDPTNASPRFLRNRVRHEVLPLLESVRPGAAAALARAAWRAAEDDEALSGQARALGGPPWATAQLAEASPAVSRRALLDALEARGASVRASHLDAVLDAVHALSPRWGGAEGAGGGPRAGGEGGPSGSARALVVGNRHRVVVTADQVRIEDVSG